MEAQEEDRKLLEQLVKWSGFAPSKLATEAGLTPTTITRPLAGKVNSRLSWETRRKLRERFPDFPQWDSGNKRVLTEVSNFGDRPFDEKFGLGDLPAIPVVGSAMGAASYDPEGEIEFTELDMSEVLDRIRRPASLANDDRAYAVTVVGESMAPKYESGARVIVSPRRPAAISDYVVVQLKGADPENQFAERITTVLIKRLVRRSTSFIELRQFNPEKTFRVEMERVAAIHKVIGEVY